MTKTRECAERLVSRILALVLRVPCAEVCTLTSHGFRCDRTAFHGGEHEHIHRPSQLRGGAWDDWFLVRWNGRGAFSIVKGSA